MTVLLILGSLLVFVALLMAFGIAMARMTRWLVLRMVERRHRELEELMVYGRMPLSWTGGTSVDGWRLWLCRRRLDGLATEVRRSTLVTDEETRRQLLDRLAEVRSRV